LSLSGFRSFQLVSLTVGPSLSLCCLSSLFVGHC
jgi:hypothetical protein